MLYSDEPAHVESLGRSRFLHLVKCTLFLRQPLPTSSSLPLTREFTNRDLFVKVTADGMIYFGGAYGTRTYPSNSFGKTGGGS